MLLVVVQPVKNGVHRFGPASKVFEFMVRYFQTVVIL